MKITRINTDIAKRIIVYGEDKAFTIFQLQGSSYTIYHREFENKHCDILEMITYDEKNDKEIYTYYLMDPIEVKQLQASMKGVD